MPWMLCGICVPPAYCRRAAGHHVMVLRIVGGGPHPRALNGGGKGVLCIGTEESSIGQGRVRRPALDQSRSTTLLIHPPLSPVDPPTNAVPTKTARQTTASALPQPCGCADTTTGTAFFSLCCGCPRTGDSRQLTGCLSFRALPLLRWSRTTLSRVARSAKVKVETLAEITKAKEYKAERDSLRSERLEVQEHMRGMLMGP